MGSVDESDYYRDYQIQRHKILSEKYNQAAFTIQRIFKAYIAKKKALEIISKR